jgi:hypothetical protein
LFWTTLFQVRIVMNVRIAICAALLLSASGSLAQAQNPDYPGYLGVYVAEGNGGMRITGFIDGTPADELAGAGEIDFNDTILSLNGRATRTLGQLKAARNNIPDGYEAKMVFRTSRGVVRHCWIGRSESTVLSPNGGADRFSDAQDGTGGAAFTRLAP